MIEIAAYAASVAIGLCLGLIGAGGSILTIPVFVYILKTSPAVSTTYSMFIVGLCSLAGSIQSWIKKLVDTRAVLLFGIPSVISVCIARTLLFPALPKQLCTMGTMVISRDAFIMFCLAVIMFVVSIKMLRVNNKIAEEKNGNEKRVLPFILQGILTGMVTGMLGVGGGFLIMPALVLWLKLPVKMAIGTALFIIAVNSAVGFISSYSAVAIQWPLLLKFAAGAVTGIFIGTKLSEKIKADNLKKGLGWFIIFTSLYVLYKQFQICTNV